MTPHADREKIRSLSRPALEVYQLERLNHLLEEVLPQNEFYTKKLSGLKLPIEQIANLSNLPFTTKDELVGDDPHGHAANRTFQIEQYTRFHQTSGTQGQPLIVLDTPEDWNWWTDAWQYVLDAAEINSNDRCLLAFSFGPFIGFWSAFDALIDRGCLTIPSGGLSSLARLDRISTVAATCLFCTPTYALRLAEVAKERNQDLRGSTIRKIVVAGEPGGSLESVRQQIETEWDAQVLDHAGATEIGPWGFGQLNAPGLYVNEAEFIVECINPETTESVGENETGELVLTSLGRIGHPILRYRTGDLVRYTTAKKRTRETPFVYLADGILGRVDQMLIIRGVNILPTAVEQIIREFVGMGEFRLTAKRIGAMDELMVEVEVDENRAMEISEQLQIKLGLRVDVKDVPSKTLPRFEGKAKRFVDLRSSKKACP